MQPEPLSGKELAKAMAAAKALGAQGRTLELCGFRLSTLSNEDFILVWSLFDTAEMRLLLKRSLPEIHGSIDADDLVAESMAKCFRALKSGEKIRYLSKTILMNVLRHTHLDFLRRTGPLNTRNLTAEDETVISSPALIYESESQSTLNLLFNLKKALYRDSAKKGFLPWITIALCFVEIDEASAHHLVCQFGPIPDHDGIRQFANCIKENCIVQLNGLSATQLSSFECAALSAQPLTYEEAAKVLGEPKSTLGSRILAIRQKLTKIAFPMEGIG